MNIKPLNSPRPPSPFALSRTREGLQPETVAQRVREAKGFFSRFRGLMLRRELAPLDGLLISPCNSIHTFFMRFDIDVVCLDPDLRIVETRPRMKRRRLFLPKTRTFAMLELAAGHIEKHDLRPGDQLIAQ